MHSCRLLGEEEIFIGSGRGKDRIVLVVIRMHCSAAKDVFRGT